MATTQALQTLQDEFRRVLDQGKTTQGSLQQLRGAKKEADIKRRRQEVLGCLGTMQESMDQLQRQMLESKESLKETMEEADSSPRSDTHQATTSETNKGKKPIGIVEARKLSPDQQEVLYELKASRMGAMQSQNAALKRELGLNGRKQRLLQARHEMAQSYMGSKALRTGHALEAKVRGANLKIKGLEEELRKSQQMALRYRELYEDGQRQGEGGEQAQSSRGGKSTRSPAPTPALRPAGQKEQSFIGPTTSVNDVVRKNECLLEENDVQKREIQRLKRDNAELILIAKTSATDRDTVFARLGTSESARQDLLKRHNKLKEERAQLSRSYTRQAADWIESKKQQQQTEAQGRWQELYPVAPHGGKDRFFDHGGTPTCNQPRQMYPVEKYGGQSVA